MTPRATRILVNNDSDIGLLPDSTEPLPEPMLTPDCWHPPRGNFAENTRGMQTKNYHLRFNFGCFYAFAKWQWVTHTHTLSLGTKHPNDYAHSSCCVAIIDNQESLWCQLCGHWWQQEMPPVTKYLASWWLSVFFLAQSWLGNNAYPSWLHWSNYQMS